MDEKGTRKEESKYAALCKFNGSFRNKIRVKYYEK